jgi:hypothetical protein
LRPLPLAREARGRRAGAVSQEDAAAALALLKDPKRSDIVLRSGKPISKTEAGQD